MYETVLGWGSTAPSFPILHSVLPTAVFGFMLLGFLNCVHAEKNRLPPREKKKKKSLY
jgi:hypothetical protein